MKVQLNTGGYTGKVTGNCVARSIAIAADLPYEQVCADIKAQAKIVKAATGRKVEANPNNGVERAVYEPYLKSLGFRWVPTMRVGQGCTTHLTDGEIPNGRIIARLSKHLCAVIDGVINDTFDPQRDGTRCVYGYFMKEN